MAVCLIIKEVCSTIVEVLLQRFLLGIHLRKRFMVSSISVGFLRVLVQWTGLTYPLSPIVTQ